MLHYRSIIGADDQALKYVQSNQGYFYTMFLYQNIECDPLWHVVLDPEIEVKYPFIENLKQDLSIQKLFGFFSPEQRLYLRIQMLCRGLTILINQVAHDSFARRYIKIID